MRTTMRKVLAYGPAVVVSMVLTFAVGAVLPATVGLALSWVAWPTW